MLINVASVSTLGSTPVHSIAIRSYSIQQICIPIKEIWQNGIRTCVGNVLIEDDGAFKHKIKTVIMYILYKNIYLEPNIEIFCI